VKSLVSPSVAVLTTGISPRRPFAAGEGALPLAPELAEALANRTALRAPTHN
jgi:hypothetical protein